MVDKDQVIADKLWAWFEKHDVRISSSAERELREILPPKPLPTLADMTPEEREKCRWMQADVKLFNAGSVTRAEEAWEHRHEYQATDDQQWYPLTAWRVGEPDRRPWDVTPTRIVLRRVSPVEVAE